MIHTSLYPTKKNEVTWLDDVSVVGVTFQSEGMQAISQPKIRNLEFSLKAEPSNIHDANAIAVMATFSLARLRLQVQVGYLEKNLAKWIRERAVLDQLRVAGHKLFEDELDMVLGIRLVLNRKETKDDS